MLISGLILIVLYIPQLYIHEGFPLSLLLSDFYMYVSAQLELSRCVGQKRRPASVHGTCI